MKPYDLVVTRKGARFKGRFFPCSVGRGGIGIKNGEGDNITPVGEHKIEWVFQRPERVNIRSSLPVVNTPLHLGWSDDPQSASYNQTVNLPCAESHETLRRADPLYDLVAVLDINRHPIIPGKGSAVFLHIWRRPRYPTAGCVAFCKQDLIWILEHWEPQSRVVIPPV